MGEGQGSAAILARDDGAGPAAHGRYKGYELAAERFLVRRRCPLDRDGGWALSGSHQPKDPGLPRVPGREAGLRDKSGEHPEGRGVRRRR